MVVALLLLTAVGYFRGPASTLAALHDAARARDSAAVAGLIDGEALRHSLGRLLLQQTPLPPIRLLGLGASSLLSLQRHRQLEFDF